MTTPSNQSITTMNILLRAVTVYDKAGPHHLKTLDIRISDGVVQSIGNHLSQQEDEQVIEQKGMCISPGWVDLHVDFADPGSEDREDIERGVAAAIAGGFTGAVLMPSTNPVIDYKAGVEYVRKSAEHLPFYLYPAGAVTKARKGAELAEMFDMHRAGAICFTDDWYGIAQPERLKLALQYVQQFDAPIFVSPQEPSLVKGAQMHEGVYSTQLGLKGMPVMAEVVQLERDLQLLRYSGGRLHVMGVSSAEAVNIIERAKEEGLSISADVNIANLVATDADLMDYDAHYKFYPPLRSEADRLALLEGLRKGVLDAVSSDHRPQLIETKACEFSNASFGSIGLESCFGLLGTTGLPVETSVEALSRLPRAILGVPDVHITEGQLAQFTLFNPDETWTFSNKAIQSKSRNTPFLGRSLKGRPMGIIVDDTMVTY